MTDLEKLEYIHRLLKEAYEHYFEHDNDGHKSGEAHISVDYGNFWEREEAGGLTITGVEIYSYVLGPHRTHTFDSLDEAIQVVEQWHRQQIKGLEEECLYTKIKAEKRARFEEAMEEMERLFGEPQEYYQEYVSEERDHER